MLVEPVRSTFEDLLSLKKHDSYFNMVRDFIGNKRVDVYSFSELKERYYVLFWLARNATLFASEAAVGVSRYFSNKLCAMPGRTEILPVYFVPRRTRDFTGANRRYALWVIDEFSGYDLDLETLNMILDGQRMQLDSKYGRVFEKTDNVPVIMLGNSVLYIYNCDSFVAYWKFLFLATVRH